MKRVEQRGAARKNKLRQLFGQKYAFNELGGDARPYGIMEMMEWIRKHGAAQRKNVPERSVQREENDE